MIGWLWKTSLAQGKADEALVEGPHKKGCTFPKTNLLINNILKNNNHFDKWYQFIRSLSKCWTNQLKLNACKHIINYFWEGGKKADTSELKKTVKISLFLYV